MFNTDEKADSELKATKKGIRKKLLDEGYAKGHLNNEEIQTVIDFIKKQHPGLSPFIGSGIGKYLMRVDSDISSEIVENLRHKNIYSIPLHDSYIVEEQHEQELYDQMINCYFIRIGFIPVIDKK